MSFDTDILQSGWVNRGAVAFAIDKYVLCCDKRKKIKKE